MISTSIITLALGVATAGWGVHAYATWLEGCCGWALASAACAALSLAAMVLHLMGMA